MGNAQTRAGVLLLVETSKACLMNLQQHNNSIDVGARSNFVIEVSFALNGVGSGLAPRHLNRYLFVFMRVG